MKRRRRKLSLAERRRLLKRIEKLRGIFKDKRKPSALDFLLKERRSEFKREEEKLTHRADKN